MKSAHIDVIKEAAYEHWQHTKKPFSAIDLLDRIRSNLSAADLQKITPKMIANAIESAKWAERKSKQPTQTAANVLYVWRGEL